MKFYLRLSFLFLSAGLLLSSPSIARNPKEKRPKDCNICELQGQPLILDSQSQIDAFDCEVIKTDMFIVLDEITDLTPLTGLRAIWGGLFIRADQGASIENLRGLDSLERVGQEFEIKNIPSLKSLDGLGKLKRVNLSFSILSLPALSSIEALSNLSEVTFKNQFANFTLSSLPSLKSLEGLEGLQKITGSLNLFGLTGLESLQGLKNLREVNNSLSLSSLFSLESLEGLDALEKVARDLRIFNLPAITSLEGLGALKSTLHFDIERLAILQSLNGLDALEEVKRLKFKDLGALAGLAGLANLREIENLEIDNLENLLHLTGLDQFGMTSGTISIKNNPILQSIDIFNQTPLLPSHLLIDNNPQLLRLVGFAGLEEIQGDVIVSRNEQLREITAFSMLSSIGQNLELKSNPSLIHLDGFTQLSHIGQNLSIRFNYALKRIGGLANLEHIGGSLTLSNSDSLEDACLLNDISQAVSTFPDNVFISIPNKLLENCETDIKIQRIYLFRADNGALVQELNEGDQIDLNQFNDIPLNIGVEVNEVFLGRVGLQLEGALAQSNASLEPPFELFGQGKPFPEGIYTLQVWVQGGNDGRGPILDYRRLNFQIGAAPTLNVGKIQLIDVLSNLPGTELKEGETVFLNPQDLRKLSIEALPSPEVIGSMRFELQGPLSHSQVENIAPYGLFGNDRGNRNKFLGEIFPQGSYQLKVFAYPSSQAQGSAADSLTLNFEVRYESPNQPSLERLEVIGFRPDNRNSNISNQDLPTRLLQDGDTLTFKRQSPPRFSIRAISNPLEVGSVHFKLRGRRAFEQTENLFPYDLFGNYGQEQFFYDKEFPEGNYTLEVTPYSEKNLQGQAGETLKIDFWVQGEYADIRINHFELHSRATGQKVIGIGNRDTLRKEKLGPGAFDVHAITVPENIGSVVYQVKRPNDLRFSGEFFARNNPYIVLRGTDLSPGQYQILATPFTEAQGEGDFGRTVGLTFEVIESMGVLIYPNPSSGQFQIQPEQGGTLEIFSPQGEQIWEGLVEAKMSQSLEIPEGKPGTYILRITNNKGVIEQRILIR